MHELNKYILKNQGIKKAWIAERLNISRQRLHQLEKVEKLPQDIVLKLKGLK